MLLINPAFCQHSRSHASPPSMPTGTLRISAEQEPTVEYLLKTVAKGPGLQFTGPLHRLLALVHQSPAVAVPFLIESKTIGQHCTHWKMRSDTCSISETSQLHHHTESQKCETRYQKRCNHSPPALKDEGKSQSCSVIYRSRDMATECAPYPLPFR